MTRRTQFLSFALVSLSAAAAFAQSPTGLWKTIDDASGKEKSIVRISETGGVFTGKIEKVLDPTKQEAKCVDCGDDRKNQLIIGMTIIKNVKKDGDKFDGGEILDPNNGKTYKVRMTVSGDNKKLDVRGYIGTPMLGRTQTWSRVE